ncbi:hypothetical protein EK21DRAFT_95372 [Setomelanomma holmii]|uniref:PD-(D/E)XK nuclease-like domain-containing protein n=1 Tax=Setomelanomma holmii TaxID=210430 RepID=A0A9P4GVQ7_9PLEO|nr:hypothetical protein EK21DRAFT_95372 [Setomelanomma holmii]
MSLLRPPKAVSGWQRNEPYGEDDAQPAQLRLAIIFPAAPNHPATNRTPAHIPPPAGRSGRMRPCGCCAAYSDTVVPSPAPAGEGIHSGLSEGCAGAGFNTIAIHPAHLPLHLRPHPLQAHYHLQQNRLLLLLLTPPPSVCRPLQDPPPRSHQPHHRYLHPLYAGLYKTLRHAPISHTTDTCTEAAALFTGIVVKSPSGNLQEAQLQMSIWMVASLRIKANLAWLVFATDALPRRPDHEAFIERGITIIGTEHTVYYAYLSEPDSADLSQDTSTSTCAVSILGNDNSLPSLDTSSVQGVLRVARLYGNLMKYAADEDAETEYWGAFLGPVSDSLARRVGGM